MDTADIVRDYYNNLVQREWERLERHCVEFALTKHYLDQYINPGDIVLDIGGGPGRYSLYLAEKGCRVTLLDLSDENVAFAQSKAAENGLDLRAIQGNACEADKLLSGAFDHILLMGPLYHLLEEAERTAAVNAALRLLKPGGILFVSFISLNAGILYYLKEDPQAILEAGEQAYIDCFLSNKTYCGDAFTKACFIAPHEIEPFFTQFDLEKRHLLAQEGIGILGEDKICACSQEAYKRWVALSIAVCEREELLSHAAHLMYIGKKIHVVPSE